MHYHRSCKIFCLFGVLLLSVTLYPYAGETASNITAKTNACSKLKSGSLNGTLTPTLPYYFSVVGSESVAVGDYFYVSLTVRNNGTQTAPGFVLYFYTSETPGVSCYDTLLKTDSFPSLMPGSCFTIYVKLRAPDTPGVHAIGFCTDPSNFNLLGCNCFRGITITVTPPPPPDLVFRSLSVVGSDTLAVGQVYLLEATIENQNDNPANSTTLAYYSSPDPDITDADTRIDTDILTYLPGGGWTTKSTLLVAPATPGEYWVGACIDDVDWETSTSNNCSLGVMITVIDGTFPDIAVHTPSLSVTSAVNAGQPFSFNLTMENQGSAPAGSSTIRYYYSSDATINSADTLLGTNNTASLSAGTSSIITSNLSAPGTPGAYYIGGCVDPATGETLTSNNCSLGVPLAVASPPAPDLVVHPPALSGTGAIVTGQPFSLNITVENQGSGTAGNTTLTYYFSEDATISSSDTILGTDSLLSLASGADTTMSAILTAPERPGYLWIGACAEAVSSETSVVNNCSNGVLMTITSIPAQVHQIVLPYGYAMDDWSSELDIHNMSPETVYYQLLFYLEDGTPDNGSIFSIDGYGHRTGSLRSYDDNNLISGRVAVYIRTLNKNLPFKATLVIGNSKELQGFDILSIYSKEQTLSLIKDPDG